MKSTQGCAACRDGAALPFAFTMAFQPILDLSTARVWGYEALVRGTQGEPAGAILSQVNDETRYRFDQAARVKAIELAGSLFPVDEDVRLHQLHAERGLRTECLHPRVPRGGEAGRLLVPPDHVRVHRERAFRDIDHCSASSRPTGSRAS